MVLGIIVMIVLCVVGCIIKYHRHQRRQRRHDAIMNMDRVARNIEAEHRRNQNPYRQAPYYNAQPAHYPNALPSHGYPQHDDNPYQRLNTERDAPYSPHSHNQQPPPNHNYYPIGTK